MRMMLNAARPQGMYGAASSMRGGRVAAVALHAPDMLRLGGYYSRQSKSPISWAATLVLATVGVLGSLLVGSQNGSIPKDPPPVVAVAERNVDFDVTSGWSTKEVRGTFNGARINVDLGSNWSTKTINGTVNGQSVNQEITSSWSNRTVSGNFQGQTVNLTLEPSGMSEKTISGTFQGESVDVTVSNNWGTRYITGNLGSRKVNLKSEGAGWGERRLTGTIGLEEVDTTISSDWSVKHVTGGVQFGEKNNIENNFLLNLILFNQIRYSSGKTTVSMLEL